MAKSNRLVGMPIAILVTVILFGATLAGGILITSTDSGQKTTSGLNTLSGYNLAGEVSSVWGLTYNTSTWHAGTLTLNKATGEVTAAFPAHTVIDEIVFLTNNASQQTYTGLYQNNLVFTYQTFSMTSGYGNLSAAYMYFGFPVNDTATTAASDKGISGFAYNATLFDSGTNNLGQTLQIPANGMQMSAPTSTPQYAFYLQENKTANLTTGLTVSFTQYWEYTVAHPMIGLDPLTFSAILALAIFAVGALFLYRFVVPDSYGSENSRVTSFQNKRERTYTGVAIAIFAIELVFIGWLGDFSPLFGFGALMGALPIGAMFVVDYTALPGTQKWGTAIGFMNLGFAIGIVGNLFTGFGTIAYNYLISGIALPVIAGFASLAVALPVLYMGLQNTKREHLKRRYGHEESGIRG